MLLLMVVAELAVEAGQSLLKVRMVASAVVTPAALQLAGTVLVLGTLACSPLLVISLLSVRQTVTANVETPTLLFSSLVVSPSH